MTWSLKVQNGDLTLSNASYGVVTAQSKLHQDLRHHILERMGTDISHPSYGSLIDGGTLPTGIETEGVIGRNDLEEVVLEIESDIRRICAEYQEKQLNRAKGERLTYNKTTLTKGEILVAVDAITFEQIQDTLRVTVELTTGANQSASLDFLVQGPVIGS